MSFPLVNATITQIVAPNAEEYDETENPTVVWSGAAKAYVREELVDDPNAGRLDVLRKTTIVVPAAVGKLVQTEHRITYTYRDGTHTRLVKSATWVPQLNRSRLALEDE